MCFSVKNARSTNPPKVPCVFSGEMRLASLVTVNSYDPRPTAPGFHIFFSTKTCVAGTLPDSVCFLKYKTSCAQCDCKLFDSRPTASTFLVSFIENARRRNPATFLKFTFIVLSQVQCVLGSQVIVNSHVRMPVPAGCRFFFQGKTRLTGIAGKFQSWNKGIC